MDVFTDGLLGTTFLGKRSDLKQHILILVMDKMRESSFIHPTVGEKTVEFRYTDSIQTLIDAHENVIIGILVKL